MIPEAWRRGEVAVVGLGKSGVAASKWLAAQGLRVYASDAADAPHVRESAAALSQAGLSVEIGRHDLDRIRQAVAVVVSPGVSPEAPPIMTAREAGIDVISEIDLAARALDPTRLIVVTGTNGKSTTTALVAHILRQAGIETVAAGNIGRPLIELASEPTHHTWVAVEASSFQLHDSPHLTPAVGVLTNLSPDHLDRYPDVTAYYEDKRLLFRNASPESIWVLNADDTAVLELAEGIPGIHRHWSVQREDDAWFDRADGRLMLEETSLLERAALPLLGDHNVANALAAALAAAAAGVDARAIGTGLATLSSLPHRLEPIRDVGGVRWINDSKATNVASTMVALRAMDQPFVLILGGRHKGESFAPLAASLEVQCRVVLGYGAARDRVADDLMGAVRVHSVVAFDDAVERASELAEPGETVLLSPACASFDQFANYEERGARFRQLVEAM